MRRIFRGAALLAIVAGVFSACDLDYFKPDNFAGGSYKPTVAVPLANLNLTVEDLLKSYENNVILEPEGDGRSRLNLIFSDTMAPVKLESFATAGVVPPGQSLDLPTEKVDLRLFGAFQDGFFRFTNPSVIFTLHNTSKVPLSVEFRDGANSDFYTVRKDGSNQRYILIDDAAANHPFPLPADAGFYNYSLNDNNIDYTDDIGAGDAMTQILEPTPKFLHYGTRLHTNNVAPETDLNGEISVITSVHLPLRGYGNVSRWDTLKYEFIDTGQVDELNFVEIRFNITNGLPLEAEIKSAIIVDTTTTPWTKVMDIPLTNEDGSISDGIFIPGATGVGESSGWKYTKAEKLSEIILTRAEKVQPVNFNSGVAVGPEITQIEAIAQGNKILMNVQVYTAGINQTTNQGDEIKMYSNQSMNIKIGVRAQASLEIGDYLPGNE